MKIVTDSSCDLPKDLIEKHNIDVIPLKIEIDGIDYTDGVDLNHEEFFTKMKTSPTLPKTSQPSPQSFFDSFKNGVEDYKEVLSIHLSSKLSATFDAANVAKEKVEGDIETFDTLSGSIGVGLQVLKAAELAKEGLSKSALLETLREYRDQMNVVVYLETLENAVKGGRVSKPKEFVANLFNLKPIVHVEDGHVKILKTLRGKKRGVRTLIEEMEKKNIDFKDRIIGITHCDCLEDALALKEEIMEKFSPKEILLTTMGPVIGTHAGPGGLLVCF